MEVGMSVDEYAKLVFTMITSLAIIVLVMALAMDDDNDSAANSRRTRRIFRDRYARRWRHVDLEEETVEN